MTISVCMIVKNEAGRLGDCLDSLCAIADEIIIVDTGSVDETKLIASKYTDKIYDYAWTGSFSDARNFAFSKATMDYIYSADADETLDAENQQKFLQLKEALLPEIEIVQMYYCNQLENNTIYSYDKEYRPKLYKRVRRFVWQEKIHEAVALSPVVYDSEIEIIHKPGAGHAKRDLAAFERLVAEGEEISPRLQEIYAKELMIAGEEENFNRACGYFETAVETAVDEATLLQAACVAAHCYRVKKDASNFFKYAMKAVALGGCSEMCFEIGEWYYEARDFAEAKMWYYNAAKETHALLALSYEQELPEGRLTELNDV